MIKPRGISLVENIIAILLLAILITVSLLALTSARFQSVTAKHHYQAINLARDRIEDIISGSGAAAGTQAVAIDPATGLNGSLTISYPVAGTIDITVTWTEIMWVNIPSSETIVMRMP